jgi:hypothetical protein
VDADVLRAIERDWKDGLLSPTLIRIKHGLGDSDAVVALAARHGWGDRKSIQAKIKDGTLREVVNQSAPKSDPGGSFVDEDQQMSAYNQMVAGVIRHHHQGLGRGRTLADRMLVELEEIQPPEVDQGAIDSLANVVEKTNPELAAHLRAHIGPVNPKEKLAFLGKRIGMLRDLSQTQVTYIDAERTAYGLNEESNRDGVQFDDVVDEAQRRIAHLS